MRSLAIMEFTAGLKRRLPAGGFVRRVSVVAGGVTLGQGLIMLSSPILTRLYSPTELGALAVFMSAVSILTTIASFRYEATIPLPEDDETAANLLVLSLLLVLFVSAACGLAILTWGNRLAHGAGAAGLRPCLWLLPLSLCGSGIYQVFNHWAIRKNDFAPVARAQISQGLCQVIAQVGLGLLRVGAPGLLIGDAIGRTSGSDTLASIAWRRDRRAIRFVSIARMRDAASRYRQFPLLSCPSVLLNAIGLQLPILLLASFYGTTITGWFALGHRVILAPTILVGRAVSQVYFAEASRLARSQPEALRPLFRRTVLALLLVGPLPILLLALKGPWLFGLIFGKSWEQSGLYVGILVPMVFMQFLAFPVGGSLDAVKRQDLHLIREILRVVSMAAAVIWSGRTHQSPTTTVAIISLVGTLGYFGHLVASWRAIESFIASRGTAAGSQDGPRCSVLGTRLGQRRDLSLSPPSTEHRAPSTLGEV